jgi:hypothetical protein
MHRQTELCNGFASAQQGRYSNKNSKGHTAVYTACGAAHWLTVHVGVHAVHDPAEGEHQHSISNADLLMKNKK